MANVRYENRGAQRRNVRPNAYVSGTAVREQQPQRRGPEVVRTTQARPGHRKEHGRGMTFGYLAFMCALLVVAGLILTWYITMQSEIANSVKHISTLESQLAELRQENDEAYNNANSKLDLEEIKRIAIQEYGMQYADQGQIVTYSDEGGNDYVRQNAEIPEVSK